MAANPFFTIGHSTRPTEAFVALLREAEVRLVVDVRTAPRSRTNPQFNRDVLPASLAPSPGARDIALGLMGGHRMAEHNGKGGRVAVLRANALLASSLAWSVPRE